MEYFISAPDFRVDFLDPKGEGLIAHPYSLIGHCVRSQAEGGEDVSKRVACLADGFESLESRLSSYDKFESHLGGSMDHTSPNTWSEHCMGCCRERRTIGHA